MTESVSRMCGNFSLALSVEDVKRKERKEKEMLIRAKLLELGIDGEQMRVILKEKYKICGEDGKSPVSKGMYSSSVSGRATSDKAIRIRNACWDYINKRKEKV